jgi:hypothetical protein
LESLRSALTNRRNPISKITRAEWMEVLHKWKSTHFSSVKVQTPVPPKKMQKFLSPFARTSKQITQHREVSNISYIPFQYKKSSVLYPHRYMHDDHSIVPEIKGPCDQTFPD